MAAAAAPGYWIGCVLDIDGIRGNLAPAETINIIGSCQGLPVSAPEIAAVSPRPWIFNVRVVIRAVGDHLARLEIGEVINAGEGLPVGMLVGGLTKTVSVIPSCYCWRLIPPLTGGILTAR